MVGLDFSSNVAEFFTGFSGSEDTGVFPAGEVDADTGERASFLGGEHFLLPPVFSTVGLVTGFLAASVLSSVGLATPGFLLTPDFSTLGLATGFLLVFTGCSGELGCDLACGELVMTGVGAAVEVAMVWLRLGGEEGASLQGEVFPSSTVTDATNTLGLGLAGSLSPERGGEGVFLVLMASVWSVISVSI